MAVQLLEKDDQYILNHCTKYLARTRLDPYHNYNGQYPDDDPRSYTAECWRFPILDSYSDGADAEKSYALNKVTIVYDEKLGPPSPKEITVIGSFADLYEPIALSPVNFQGAATRYHAVCLAVPKGEIHRYQFAVDGKLMVDPINPQRITMDNGAIWSRFFTHLCTEPLSFERWEWQLMDRLTSHILPFRTREGQRFLDQFYNSLDEKTKESQYLYAYRLDEPVGTVNFIDNLLSREEHYHLQDYKTCLSIIDTLLRRREPNTEPPAMSKELYIQLYDEMASNNVPDWDYKLYDNPRYFLTMLRRHTWTGAFSHPKYGGNVGCAGWAYLEETYRDQDGNSVFNWRRALEQPIGNNTDYRA